MASSLQQSTMNPITASSFEAGESFLTTGCRKIDELLRGGLSKKGVTQIYGEAGCGKTQLALQLCLAAQTVPSGNQASGVIYICTNTAFPSSRLQELLKTSPIAKEHNLSGDRIFVEHVPTVGKLEFCITHKIPHLLDTKRINLLVIDAIAAPYRVEFDGGDLKARAKSLRKIGRALHIYSCQYNLCIVCINEVSAAMGNIAAEGLCNEVLPTLGLTWGYQVTNSICLCRKANERHIHIRGSSYLPRQSLCFEITQSGVHGLGEIL